MTATERLLNLTPVAVKHLRQGPVIIARSAGADGNSVDGLARATARARANAYSHVEAHDVITGERYYLAVG